MSNRSERHEVSPGQFLIEGFYDSENSDGYREATSMTFSITMQLEHWAMLKAISNRFGVTSSGILARHCEELVNQMFNALTPEDKRICADSAESFAVEHAAKKGITWESTSGKFTWWPSRADDRQEPKK